MRSGITTTLILPCLMVLAGCLTVETKEYHITMHDNRSGEARIVFCNVTSESDDTLDLSREDFAQLINNYISGNQFEQENPGFHDLRKRLYEKDGKLYGEITFRFDSVASLRLFQYDSGSPYMYFVGSPLSSEVLVETDGTFGGAWMPVVFWPRDTREMFIKTRIITQAPYHRSLLAEYRRWIAAGRPATLPEPSHE